MSDYMISAVGIMPLLLGAPSVSKPAELLPPMNTQVYRQDLVSRVDALLIEIRDLIDSLAPSLDLADLLYLEDPDHPPYSSAYELQPIELVLAEAPPRRDAHDEAPEVWL